MKQHIRELYKQGLSTRKIAKGFDISYITVWRWCKDIIRTQSESLMGNKHPAYKGGHIDKNGYKRIWKAGKLCYEHRLKMQKFLSRTLGKEELIHHIDGNPLNNKISNLEIMTPSNHRSYHNLNKNLCANI